MPDVIRALSAIPQGSKDNDLLDYTWQPMVRIRKAWITNDPDLMKRYPTGEMPNPRFGPVRLRIPAWLFLIAPIIGISVYAILNYGVDKLVGDIREYVAGQDGSINSVWDIFTSTPFSYLAGK